VAGPLGHVTDDVALFMAEAPHDAVVVIDAEHDHFAWVALDEAVRRCLPAVVGEGLLIVDARLSPGAP
jgi:hypothetical protein